MGVDTLFFKGGWGEEETEEGGRGLGEEGGRGGTLFGTGIDCIFLSGALGELLDFYESIKDAKIILIMTYIYYMQVHVKLLILIA